MRDELSCEIVKDLLPNYIEELTSDYTNEAVQNHLEECENCSKTYKLLSKKSTNEDIKNDNLEEVKVLKTYMKKVRRKNLLLGIIVTCVIVFSGSLIYDKLVNTSSYEEPSKNVEITELYQLDDNYMYFTLKSNSNYLVDSMKYGPGQVGEKYVGMEITFSRPPIGRKLSKLSDEEKGLNLNESFVVDIGNERLINLGSLVKINPHITADEIINYVENESMEKDTSVMSNYDKGVYYVGKNEDDKLLIWEEGMELPKYPN